MKIVFLIDSIDKIHPEKDTSVLLIEEAIARDFTVYIFEQKDLWLENDSVFAHAKKLMAWNNIECEKKLLLEKNEIDFLFMRKDPPVNLEYIYTTLFLDLAEKKGVKVINSPHALRDVNEKLFITWFPQCCVPTLVSRSAEQLKIFLEKHQDIILKPLNGMGGKGIFRVTQHDHNLNVILESVTHHFERWAMAQKFIPEVKNGDKRIFMMHGKAFPYAISRLAKPGETRANLAAGGSYKPAHLTERDEWICEQVAPVLKAKNLMLVGLDIIGDYLTEINVTSPTCLKEINSTFNINAAAYFFDGLIQDDERKT